MYNTNMRSLIILLLLHNGCCPEAFSLPGEARSHRRVSPSNNERPTPKRSTHRGGQDGVDATAGPTPTERRENLEDFPYHAVIGELFGSEAKLFWDVGVESSDISFGLEMSVPGNASFVGLGFSPRGDGREADAVLISWSGKGVDVMDLFSDESGTLQRDRHQDYVLEHFQLLHGDDLNLLEVVLTRAIDTNDPEDYRIEWGTTRTFIASGNGRLGSLPGSNLSGMTFIEKPLSLLRSGRRLPSISPAESFSRDFLVENIVIPEVPTTYWCHTLELDLPGRAHGIEYEPLITAGNEGIVHHMELYHCEAAPDQRLPPYSGPCNQIPAELGVCSKVVAAWATGAGPMIYPTEAGVPLGGPGWSPHVMLEVHYNNPRRIAGLPDSSGIRYTFTPSLRQFDVGVLEVGVTYSPNLAIPPGEPNFTWSGLCLSRCTSKGLPPGGIRVFASQLHAHLSGREITTRHYRGHRELPPIDKDPHFTMGFQDIRLLPEDVVILPGDTLVTSCRFDTSERENVTVGGYGSREEMCVNYLHYYPKTDLEVCKSTLSGEALRLFFREAIGVHFSSQPSTELRNSEDLFPSITWSETNKHLWRQAVSSGSIDEECLGSNGDPFPGDWTNMKETRAERIVAPESEEFQPFM